MLYPNWLLLNVGSDAGNGIPITNLFFPDLFYSPKNEILSRWIVEEDDCAVIAIRRKRSLSFLIVCFRYQSPPYGQFLFDFFKRVSGLLLEGKCVAAYLWANVGIADRVFGRLWPTDFWWLLLCNDSSWTLVLLSEWENLMACSVQYHLYVLKPWLLHDLLSTLASVFP